MLPIIIWQQKQKASPTLEALCMGHLFQTLPLGNAHAVWEPFCRWLLAMQFVELPRERAYTTTPLPLSSHNQNIVPSIVSKSLPAAIQAHFLLFGDQCTCRPAACSPASPEQTAWLTHGGAQKKLCPLQSFLKWPEHSGPSVKTFNSTKGVGTQGDHLYKRLCKTSYEACIVV